MTGEQVKEILTGSDAVLVFRHIILDKSKKGFIADLAAQRIDELRTVQINRVAIGFKTLEVINRLVNPTRGAIVIDPEIPPPFNQVRIGVFVKKFFRIGSEGFIQPGFQGLVVTNLGKKPLMGRLVHGNDGQVTFGCALIKVIKALTQKKQPVILHPVQKITLYYGQVGMLVWAEQVRIERHGIDGVLQGNLPGPLVDWECVAGHFHHSRFLR